MEAAYVFGHVGNLASEFGRGWSVEDQYAWAIGAESELSLPVPGDEGAYAIRFDVHPLTYPDLRPSQRLIVLAGDVELARATLTDRTVVEVVLPPSLTRGQSRIDLTLRHPDAIRPSEARSVEDGRLLSVCFHAASLVGVGDPVTRAPPNLPRPRQPTLLRAVVAGNYTALQLAWIYQRMRALRDRLAVHYIDAGTPVQAPADVRAVEQAQICWFQADTGPDHLRAALRERLPRSCEVVTFPTPHCNALWPFQGKDARLVRDPLRYTEGRYPFGDRIAAGLAQFNITNDVVLMIYESMVEREMPNLDAALAADIEAWRAMDARCDIKLADRMAAQFRANRLFIAPTVPGAALLRELAVRLLAWPPVRGRLDPAAVVTDLDRLLEGYVGRREELPIHPRVARHFQLGWWREDIIYRWANNRYGFRDYVIDYIRWAPWRP